MIDRSDNLHADLQPDLAAEMRRRRRSRFAAALALGLAAALMSLGISTGRTALSSAALAPDEPSVPSAGLSAGPNSSTARVRGTLDSLLVGAGARSSPVDRDRIRAEIIGTRAYDGRPVRAAYSLRMRVTAYSPDERSCGGSADGITASGYSVFTNGGFLVAADPRILPMGSLLSVPGYDGGAIVPVLDVGGAIKGNRLDVLFPTHEVAMEWGVRELEVTVWEYADGLPGGFKRLRRPAK